MKLFIGNQTREIVLRAAMARFSNYGYKRTSVEDIAQEASVTRPTVYAHFKNKRNILRCVSEGIHQATLANVESALRSDATLEGRLTASFWAWSEPFMGILFGSPHGAELIGASSTLASDMTLASQDHFQALTAKCLQKAHKDAEIDLRLINLSAKRAAEILVLSLNGLSSAEADGPSYRQRLDALVRIFLAACTPKGEKPQ